MAELIQEEKERLFSLLSDMAQIGRSITLQLENVNSGIVEMLLVARALLSLQKDELRNQKIAFFMGNSGPKQRLVELYLSIGKGKTRNELVDVGFPRGTVLRYCSDLISEMLLHVKEIQTDGEEVLGYTFVEDLTQLSQHLGQLLQASRSTVYSLP